ncbi:MAG: lytic transglycosylase domain-containing protein [Methylocystis sp.]
MLGLRAASNAHSPRNVVANAVEEASRRFHVPSAWVYAVMRAESDGDANSVSEKGAIGLMQLMPNTYAELRSKLGLGSDPFDPRDNILAGAAYLAEMFGRYGETGFLAAYNAGPQRYEDYLFRGRPLPAETTDYVARLAPKLSLTKTSIAQKDAPADTHRASIFVSSTALDLTDDVSPDSAATALRKRERIASHPLFPASPRDTTFATATHLHGGSKASTGAAPVQPSGLFFARTSSKDTP